MEILCIKEKTGYEDVTGEEEVINLKDQYKSQIYLNSQKLYYFSVEITTLKRQNVGFMLNNSRRQGLTQNAVVITSGLLHLPRSRSTCQRHPTSAARLVTTPIPSLVSSES